MNHEADPGPAPVEPSSSASAETVMALEALAPLEARILLAGRPAERLAEAVGTDVVVAVGFATRRDRMWRELQRENMVVVVATDRRVLIAPVPWALEQDLSSIQTLEYSEISRAQARIGTFESKLTIVTADAVLQLTSMRATAVRRLVRAIEDQLSGRAASSGQAAAPPVRSVYGTSVWLRWAALIAFVALPVGLVLGFLFGDPADGRPNTVLAWDSAEDVVIALAVSVALSVVATTALYFERLNRRLRPDGNEAPRTGRWLAVAIGAAFLAVAIGPVGLVLGWLARRKIESAGGRRAPGHATATTAIWAGTAYCLIGASVVVVDLAGG